MTQLLFDDGRLVRTAAGSRGPRRSATGRHGRRISPPHRPPPWWVARQGSDGEGHVGSGSATERGTTNIRSIARRTRYAGALWRTRSPDSDPGAREHNLRNVDLELPRDKLIVFTGLSGSGKSSLAFDTIYAEGQRRYVESLSAYARQFLGQMDKPDVDFIEGLSPAISIDQKSASRNPRSTVGTITEIYDYLRLLYARIGIPHCPNCGRVITRQTPQQIVDRVLAAPRGHAVPGAGAGRAGPQG